MKTQLLHLLLFLWILPLGAQTSSEKMLGSWYMYHGNHTLNKRVALVSGLQLRTYEAMENHNLSFGYVGVAYKWDAKMSTALRYGYLEIDRSIEFTDQPNAIEHRLMENVSYQWKLKNHTIGQRLQLEQRFIHFLEENTTQHRLRYRLGYQFPLLKWMSFNTNNEFFFHHKKKAYRENRFYTGLDFTTSSNTKVKVGYMKQYINENRLDRLQVGITLHTDFR